MWGIVEVVREGDMVVGEVEEGEGWMERGRAEGTKDLTRSVSTSQTTV